MRDVLLGTGNCSPFQTSSCVGAGGSDKTAPQRRSESSGGRLMSFRFAIRAEQQSMESA